ncbi:MAG: prephenate dehydratase, partial [Actinomycetota bacterium]
GLGHYCFMIDLEGHVAEELVADCLRDLKSKVEDVKFLGSYPAAGDHGPARRRDAEAGWRAADTWLTLLRDQIDT